MFLKKVFNPIYFQGEAKTKKYFEGWYFKMVSADGENSVAVIPGIALGKREEDAHAFIQILNGREKSSEYKKFAMEEFMYSEDDFNVIIGENVFTGNGITLKTDTISGRINFKNIKKWPKSLIAPGAMGWYSFIPFMKCYHGIYSIDHNLSGKLNINGAEVDFTGGKGYIEKDWGKEFPKDYIWMQCNNFDTSPASFTFSLAKVPFLNKAFPGFICGFLFKGKIYRFATYTGAKIAKLELKDGFVEMVIVKDKYYLEVTLELGGTTTLASPVAGEMTGIANESMDSKVFIKFYKNGQLIYKGEGKNTAAEIEGNVTELL